jgi:hypothetical protein
MHTQLYYKPGTAVASKFEAKLKMNEEKKKKTRSRTHLRTAAKCCLDSGLAPLVWQSRTLQSACRGIVQRYWQYQNQSIKISHECFHTPSTSLGWQHGFAGEPRGRQRNPRDWRLSKINVFLGQILLAQFKGHQEVIDEDIPCLRELDEPINSIQ